MYVVIAGAGHVGEHIAKSLLEQGHSVALIESDAKRFEVIEPMDALTIHGNAACPRCLTEAGLNSASILIAVTGSDETNIIACVIGKSKGCKTIARLRSPDYIREANAAGKLDIFGIDLAVSPYRVTANHITRMLQLPSLMEAGELSQGHSLIIEMRVNSENPYIGRMLGSIGLPAGAAVCSVSRDGQMLEPERAGPIRRDDRMTIILDSRNLLPEVETAFGMPSGAGKAVGGHLDSSIEKLVIVGATRIGIQIAQNLEMSKAIVIIDKDAQKCQQASEGLEKTMVINGDATDSNLFTDEGIEDANVLVATTDNSDFNMLSCLLAKKRGVAKTLAVVNEPELRQLFEQAGVDIALSPRMMAVDFILQHISGNNVSSTQTSLQGSGVIVMEVPVTETLWMAGKEYGSIKFPKGAFIGSVIRGGRSIRPTRFDTITPGDRIIMMALPESMPKVEKLFSYHSGTRRFR